MSWHAPGATEGRGGHKPNGRAHGGLRYALGVISVMLVRIFTIPFDAQRVLFQDEDLNMFYSMILRQKTCDTTMRGVLRLTRRAAQRDNRYTGDETEASVGT